MPRYANTSGPGLLLSVLLAGVFSLPTFAKEPFFSAELERLEYRFGLDTADVVQTEGELALGTDDWELSGRFEFEQMHADGIWEIMELQPRLSIPVSDFWDVYVGVRHNVHPRPERTYAVFGVDGLAPYFIDTTLSLFVSKTGGVSARLESNTDILLTQRLVMQPRLEVDAYANEDQDIDIGTGIVLTKLGLRLRYEIHRDIAPYIGLHHERKWGQTRDFSADDHEHWEQLFVLVGLKLTY